MSVDTSTPEHDTESFCRGCAYFRSSARTKRNDICMLTGERVQPATQKACELWIDGVWDEEKEMPPARTEGLTQKNKYLPRE